MAKKTLKVADKPTLDSMKSLLENETYGLSKIKSSISGISGEMTYPNIQVGYISSSKSVNVSGKGKITLCGSSTVTLTTSSKIDEVYLPGEMTITAGNNLVLTFEKSIYLIGKTTNITYYILQLAD